MEKNCTKKKKKIISFKNKKINRSLIKEFDNKKKINTMTKYFKQIK